MKQVTLALLITFLASCAGIMNPKLKEIQTKSEWLNPSPHIRPVSDKDKLVYLSIRNTSGSDIDARAAIKQKVQELGYRITGDLDTAKFILMADVRYMGEKSEKGYGNTVGGAVIGGVSGAVLGNTLSKKNKGRNTAIGAVGGAGLGALVGNIVDGHNQVVTYDLVCDIRIGERIDGGVKTEVRGSADRGLKQNANFGRSSGTGTENGSSRSNTRVSTKFTREEGFYYHEARLVCSATKINLTEVEASNPLELRLSRTVGQVLP